MTAVIFLILSFVISTVVNPFLISFSQKKGVFDFPEGDNLKIHKKNMPILGGTGIIISIFFTVCIFWQQNFNFKIAGFIFAMVIIFLLGLWDDLKWKHISRIRPFFKFFLLILCTLTSSIILFFVGVQFNFFPVATMSIMGSFIYIFVVINAINYQDGMDGLAGGLVFISLIGFTLLSLVFANDFTLAISFISLGAVLSFLIFNFPPAKVFMGDSGAYSLGFILTVIAILFSKPYNIYSILGPVFIIGMPIFDGIFTNTRRLLNGKSIFLGDRSHFYDKILQKGFSTKKTLAMYYFLQILLVVVGILIYR